MKIKIPDIWISSLIGLIITLFLVIPSFNSAVKSYRFLKNDNQNLEGMLKNDSISKDNMFLLRELYNNVNRDVELKSNLSVVITKNIIIAIFYFLITTIITQIILMWSKNKLEIGVIGRALKEYKTLIEKHDKIKEPFASFIAKKISDIKYLGGIAFISFSEKSYIDWLVESLDEAHKSYESTLTYEPKWFFVDEPNNGMPALEKKKILWAANDKAHIKTKTRILIYRSLDFVKYFNKLSKEEIDDFIKMNNNFKLLFVEKEKIEAYAKRNIKKFNNAIEDDFALIDGAFVMKKDSHLGGSIIFGDIKEYQEFFEIASNDKNHLYFKLIDSKEKINNLIKEIENDKNKNSIN